MTPESQLSFLVRVNDVLSEAAQMMGEGRRHKKAKTRTIDALNLHFRTIGRAVYLAEEMSVLYPGEAVFSPDVLAVLDVVEPDDDPRMAWVVADERRGLDFVLEVLHRGDRDKDLVDNVQRYARLGIPEYFVYDRLHQRIHGYRLPDANARRYRRIVPQLGHIGSAVLGLDMAIVGGKLRFFSGQAELPETIDLLDRLNGILTELEAKTEAAQAEQARAQAQAEAAQARRGRRRRRRPRRQSRRKPRRGRSRRSRPSDKGSRRCSAPARSPVQTRSGRASPRAAMRPSSSAGSSGP